MIASLTRSTFLGVLAVLAEPGGLVFNNEPVVLFCIFFVFVHIHPPFTRKRIVSLYFGRDVRTRLGVAIF